MAIPEAIQRAQDAADAAMQQLAASSQPQVVRDLNQFPAPVATPPAVPPQNATPAAPVPPTNPDFEAQYRVLQGKYNAEVPRLNQALQAANQRQEQMAQQLAQLAAKVETKPEPPKPAAEPKDVETFGTDMIEMVQRYAERIVGPMLQGFSNTVNTLTARLDKLEGTVTGVSQQAGLTREQAFYKDLKSAVPDWEAVNESAEWLAWLAETDPVYGVPRQAAIDAAQQNLNADRAASVFNTFKASRKATTSTTPSKALEAQVSPATVAAAAPPAPQSTAVITQAAITKFYMELQRGLWKGREAEAQRMENEINTAAREGRIR